MTINRLLTNIILLIAVILFSCKKESKKEPAAEIRLNKSEINFLPEGGMDSIVITSTERWKVVRNPTADWFKLSKDSGDAGETHIYIIAQVNVPNSTRSTNISINSMGKIVSPINITITQSHELKISGFMNYKAPGGATIEIYGRGFSAIPLENTVMINGVKAIVQSARNDNLKVTVPPMAGSGPIIVSSGNKTDTAKRNFIYEWIGEVVVIAGGSAGYVDGQASLAKFYHPHGISFDKNDNLFVTDYQNSKVRKLTPAGIVSTIPGRIPNWNDLTGPKTDYALPTATAINDNGDVFIVEVNADAISKYSPPNTVSLFAGGSSSYFPVDGNGTVATFYRPVDITIDATGNMFVADKDNLSIRKITPNGDVTTFAGGAWGYQDGIGTAAKFNRPMGIAIDSQGNLYVTDYFNNRIRKITPAAVVTTIAGTGSHGSSDGDALTEATFTNPNAIAVAANGIIYVSESNGDNAIRLIKPNGKVETIASFKDAASGAPFNFSGIYGLALDKNGILHASDYYNNRICKIVYK